eukprot:11599281-Alexandrium_andersonii.AAC.1
MATTHVRASSAAPQGHTLARESAPRRTSSDGLSPETAHGSRIARAEAGAGGARKRRKRRNATQ